MNLELLQVHGMPALAVSEGSLPLFFLRMEEGEIPLFIAKVEYGHEKFIVVYGPSEKCLPKDAGSVELFDAKVALLNKDGILLEPQRLIHHGHKYAEGGGMVEIDEFDAGKCQRSLFWSKAGTVGISGFSGMYCGRPIPKENILVAL